MTVRALTRRLVLAALALCSLAAVSPAEDKLPMDRRLPRTALVHVSIRSVPELQKKFNESYTGKLASDPAMKDFREQVLTALNEQASKAEGQIGLSLKELAAIPQGEVSFSLVTTKGKLSAVAVIDFGEARENVLKLLEKASIELEKKAYKRSEEEFEGTDMVIFQVPMEEQPDEKRPRRRQQQSSGFSSVAWCIKDTNLIVASSADTVKSVLRFWTDTEAVPLAENEVYKYVLEKCRGAEGEKPPVVWYVDPIGLVRAGASAGGAQGILMVGFLPQLGLDKFRAIGGTFDVATGEYDYVSRMLWYVEQPPKGVLNAFDFPAGELSPPKWVPADADGYRTVNWNIEKAYATVEATYDQFAGKGTFSKFVDEQARSNETTSVHYKKDIIDHLTGTVHIVSRSGDKPEDSPTLVAFTLKDPDAFKKSLGKLTGHPGFPGMRRDFQGTEVWDFSAGEAKFGMAVAKQQFLFATDVTLLETVLRGNTGNSLADTDDYKEVAKRFPAQCSYIGFQKTDAQYRNVLNMLKSNAIPGQTDLSIDFSKLPKFEEISKYFTPGGSYVTPDDRGLLYVDFTLRDPKAGN